MQIGELRELECGASGPAAKGRVPGLDLAFAPLRDQRAVHADVDQDADQRQHHDQQDPAGFGPAAEVPVAQDIQDDPHHQEEPEQPDEEPQRGQEYVKQRIRQLLASVISASLRTADRNTYDRGLGVYMRHP